MRKLVWLTWLAVLLLLFCGTVWAQEGEDEKQKLKQQIKELVKEGKQMMEKEMWYDAGEAFAQAIEKAQQAKLDPSEFYDRIYIDAGNCFYKGRQFKMAVEVLSGALEKYREDLQLWEVFVQALLCDGRYDEARNALAELAGVLEKRGIQEPLFVLGFAYACYLSKHYVTALGLAEEILRQEPDNYDALWLRLWCYVRFKEAQDLDKLDKEARKDLPTMDDAVLEAEKYLESNKTSATAMTLMAEIALLQGGEEVDWALQLSSDAMEANPDFGPAYVVHARALMAKDPVKHAAEIVSDLETAMQKDPACDLASYYLGCFYQEQGKKAKALYYLKVFFWSFSPKYAQQGLDAKTRIHQLGGDPYEPPQPPEGEQEGEEGGAEQEQ
jgi:tetratricopeptide (TPR) repeat protein